MEIFLWFLGGLTIGFVVRYFYKKLRELKFNTNELIDKIQKIHENIDEELKLRENKSYYPILKKLVSTYLSEIDDDLNKEKYSKSRRNSLSIYLGQIDTYYVGFRSDMRLMDNFESFNTKFSKIKREYKTKFDQSVKIMVLMEEKYDTLIYKYLTTFKSDYTLYKENNINELNRIMKECRNLYSICEFESLRKGYKKTIHINNEINLEITEPNRLRDKFILSEDNMTQVEGELINKAGNLYFKVFKGIKNSKITPDEASEWNRIKKSINSYKKSKLLSKDVIEQSDRLNQIITDMTNLYQLVKTNTHMNYTLAKD